MEKMMYGASVTLRTSFFSWLKSVILHLHTHTHTHTPCITDGFYGCFNAALRINPNKWDSMRFEITSDMRVHLRKALPCPIKLYSQHHATWVNIMRFKQHGRHFFRKGFPVYSIGAKEETGHSLTIIGAISQTTFSNAFSWMKIHKFRIRFHWSLFLLIELTIFQHWLR